MGRFGDTDDRDALERARYLERTTDLQRKEALTVAYRELGYNSAGAAKREHLDTTEATVQTYCERIAVRYGYEAVMGKPPAERGDLEPLSREDLEDAPRHVRREWREAADAHPERVPDHLRPLVEPQSEQSDS